MVRNVEAVMFDETKYFIAFGDRGWSTSASDNLEDATSVATGYLATGGPFDTSEEAQSQADRLNKEGF